MRVILKGLAGRTEKWTTSHIDLGYDLMRIFLGAAIFVRGALFVRGDEMLGDYVGRVDWFWSGILAHYVIGAHLVGGLLLALGLVTRLAAAVQLPALLGAVFIVHFREGLLAPGQSLELSALVAVMLAVFAVFGSGRLSIDHRLFAEEPATRRGGEREPVAAEPQPARA